MEEPIENNIVFHITDEQAQNIPNHFHLDYESLDEYEICTLLNNLLDRLD